MDRSRLNSLKKRKNDKLGFYISMAILFLILIFLIYLYINYYFLGGRVKSYISKGKPIAFLFLGLDEAYNQKRSDTIMVGVYNPSSKRIGIISIPRDFRLKLKTTLGYKYEKVNSIYGMYGKKKIVSTLEKFLGMDIPYYILMDISSLVKIIDILGGIEIFIDSPMKYVDKSSGLYIDLPKGVLKCDGLKAMEFIRFRADSRGDVGRIDRQLEFIVNFIRKAVLERGILTNIKLLKVLYRHIDTNINFQDAINLIRSSSDADFKNIEIVRLPGRFITLNGIDYIEPDIKKTERVINNFQERLKHIKGEYLPAEIKIQVLNGSGKSGVAHAVRDKLVRNGFNVVEFGNADFQNYQHTLILDRVGNIKKSLYVGSILNCDKVYSKIDHFLLVDVTVIVGEDYMKILR